MNFIDNKKLYACVIQQIVILIVNKYYKLYSGIINLKNLNCLNKYLVKKFLKKKYI